MNNPPWTRAKVSVQGFAYLPKFVKGESGIREGDAVWMQTLADGVVVMVAERVANDPRSLDDIFQTAASRRRSAPSLSSQDAVEKKEGQLVSWAMPETPEILQAETRTCFGEAVQLKPEKNGDVTVRIPAVAARWTAFGKTSSWAEVVAFQPVRHVTYGAPNPGGVALALIPVSLDAETLSRMEVERRLAQAQLEVEKAKLEAATARAEAAERIKAIKGSYNHYDRELELAKNGEEFFKKEAEKLAKEKAEVERRARELEAALKGWNPPAVAQEAPEPTVTPPAWPGAPVVKINIDDEPFATRKEHIRAWKAGKFPTPPRDYIEGEELVPEIPDED